MNKQQEIEFISTIARRIAGQAARQALGMDAPKPGTYVLTVLEDGTITRESLQPVLDRLTALEEQMARFTAVVDLTAGYIPPERDYQDTLAAFLAGTGRV